MRVRFFLAKAKDKRTSIAAFVHYEGVRYDKGLGISIETRYWDKTTQRAITRNYPDGKEINDRLDIWEDAIKLILRQSRKKDIDITDKKRFWKLVELAVKRAEGKEVTAKEEREIDAPKIPEYTFLEYFEKVFIRRFLLTKSEERIRRFHVVLHKLKAFEEDTRKHYRFDEMGLVFYRDLHQYMNGLDHSTNYFATFVKVIKQVLKEAHVIDKFHYNTEYQHADFKAITQEVDTVYLTEAELQKIYAISLDQRFTDRFYPRASPYTANQILKSYTTVRNRFLIGAYTGLRASDFNTLNETHVNGNFISIITDKTGDRVVIPLHPILKAILSSEHFNFSDSLSIDKTRKYIKDICRYAGITEKIEVRESIAGKVAVKTYCKCDLVGTHTARRSFATNAYLAGVPTIAIMKITSHKLESTFMRYIRISQEENAKILSEHPFFGGSEQDETQPQPQPWMGWRQPTVVS